MGTIRRAESKDIAAISRLLGQVLYVHHLGRPDLFKAKGQKFTEEDLAKMIDDDLNPIYVYEDENKAVVGHCFCEIIDRPESPNAYPCKTMFIEDLCIDENCRGQHVGREMYEFVKQYAKEHGFNNVALHAWACNPNAVGFYEHLGMQIQQYTMEEIL